MVSQEGGSSEGKLPAVDNQDDQQDEQDDRKDQWSEQSEPEPKQSPPSSVGPVILDPIADPVDCELKQEHGGDDEHHRPRRNKGSEVHRAARYDRSGDGLPRSSRVEQHRGRFDGVLARFGEPQARQARE
jgi:hypothetical protein